MSQVDDAWDIPPESKELSLSWPHILVVADPVPWQSDPLLFLSLRLLDYSYLSCPGYAAVNSPGFRVYYSQGFPAWSPPGFLALNSPRFHSLRL